MNRAGNNRSKSNYPIKAKSTFEGQKRNRGSNRSRAVIGQRQQTNQNNANDMNQKSKANNPSSLKNKSQSSENIQPHPQSKEKTQPNSIRVLLIDIQSQYNDGSKKKTTEKSPNRQKKITRAKKQPSGRRNLGNAITEQLMCDFEGAKPAGSQKKPQSNPKQRPQQQPKIKSPSNNTGKRGPNALDKFGDDIKKQIVSDVEEAKLASRQGKPQRRPSGQSSQQRPGTKSPNITKPGKQGPNPVNKFGDDIKKQIVSDIEEAKLASHQGKSQTSPSVQNSQQRPRSLSPGSNKTGKQGPNPVKEFGDDIKKQIVSDIEEAKLASHQGKSQTSPSVQNSQQRPRSLSPGSNKTGKQGPNPVKEFGDDIKKQIVSDIEEAKLASQQGKSQRNPSVLSSQQRPRSNSSQQRKTQRSQSVQSSQRPRSKSSGSNKMVKRGPNPVNKFGDDIKKQIVSDIEEAKLASHQRKSQRSPSVQSSQQRPRSNSSQQRKTQRSPSVQSSQQRPRSKSSGSNKMVKRGPNPVNKFGDDIKKQIVSDIQEAKLASQQGKSQRSPSVQSSQQRPRSNSSQQGKSQRSPSVQSSQQRPRSKSSGSNKMVKRGPNPVNKFGDDIKKQIVSDIEEAKLASHQGKSQRSPSVQSSQQRPRSKSSGSNKMVKRGPNPVNKFGDDIKKQIVSDIEQAKVASHQGKSQRSPSVQISQQRPRSNSSQQGKSQRSPSVHSSQQRPRSKSSGSNKAGKRGPNALDKFGDDIKKQIVSDIEQAKLASQQGKSQRSPSVHSSQQRPRSKSSGSNKAGKRGPNALDKFGDDIKKQIVSDIEEAKLASQQGKSQRSPSVHSSQQRPRSKSSGSNKAGKRGPNALDKFGDDIKKQIVSDIEEAKLASRQGKSQRSPSVHSSQQRPRSKSAVSRNENVQGRPASSSLQPAKQLYPRKSLKLKQGPTLEKPVFLVNRHPQSRSGVHNRNKERSESPANKKSSTSQSKQRPSSFNNINSVSKGGARQIPKQGNKAKDLYPLKSYSSTHGRKPNISSRPKPKEENNHQKEKQRRPQSSRDNTELLMKQPRRSTNSPQTRREKPQSRPVQTRKQPKAVVPIQSPQRTRNRTTINPKQKPKPKYPVRPQSKVGHTLDEQRPLSELGRPHSTRPSSGIKPESKLVKNEPELLINSKQQKPPNRSDDNTQHLSKSPKHDTKEDNKNRFQEALSEKPERSTLQDKLQSHSQEREQDQHKPHSGLEAPTLLMYDKKSTPSLSPSKQSPKRETPSREKASTPSKAQYDEEKPNMLLRRKPDMVEKIMGDLAKADLNDNETKGQRADRSHESQEKPESKKKEKDELKNQETLKSSASRSFKPHHKPQKPDTPERERPQTAIPQHKPLPLVQGRSRTAGQKTTQPIDQQRSQPTPGQKPISKKNLIGDTSHQPSKQQAELQKKQHVTFKDKPTLLINAGDAKQDTVPKRKPPSPLRPQDTESGAKQESGSQRRPQTPQRQKQVVYAQQPLQLTPPSPEQKQMSKAQQVQQVKPQQKLQSHQQGRERRSPQESPQTSREDKSQPQPLPRTKSKPTSPGKAQPRGQPQSATQRPRRPVSKTTSKCKPTRQAQDNFPIQQRSYIQPTYPQNTEYGDNLRYFKYILARLQMQSRNLTPIEHRGPERNVWQQPQLEPNQGWQSSRSTRMLGQPTEQPLLRRQHSAPPHPKYQQPQQSKGKRRFSHQNQQQQGQSQNRYHQDGDQPVVSSRIDKPDSWVKKQNDLKYRQHQRQQQN